MRWGGYFAHHLRWGRRLRRALGRAFGGRRPVRWDPIEQHEAVGNWGEMYTVRHGSGMHILNIERDGRDGLIVTFSDGTYGAYVIEELLELRPCRELAREQGMQKPPPPRKLRFRIQLTVRGGCVVGARMASMNYRAADGPP